LFRVYYRWSQDFLEAGKKQMAGDTVREATSIEVKELRGEDTHASRRERRLFFPSPRKSRCAPRSLRRDECQPRAC
jgi:hypothetical protein